MYYSSKDQEIRNLQLIGLKVIHYISNLANVSIRCLLRQTGMSIKHLFWIHSLHARKLILHAFFGCILLINFKINFFEKFFQEHH